MATIKIRTNNNWRDLTYGCDVPRDVMARDFDWLTASSTAADDMPSDGFFCYHDTWYHTSMFVRVSACDGSPFATWHGYHGDSYFSGIVIRLSDDGEKFQIGTYYTADV